ncbi:hypothetical protein [Paenibacillus jilunlii]|uniref:Uncharacterized protein n=1 Tax=Paenibacillus jilunlii TaxID=682956 RepID=A0ABR5SMW4_9BACL|nr:hypothetical protein [Paenibacillus jilunlii]KWX70766.1 hypothetical protein AML91_27370 [Paenibacillus jilunlii]
MFPMVSASFVWTKQENHEDEMGNPAIIRTEEQKGVKYVYVLGFVKKWDYNFDLFLIFNETFWGVMRLILCFVK